MKFAIFLLFISQCVYIAFRMRSRLTEPMNENDIEPYIIGGRNATDGGAPWQVAIQNSLSSSFLCGGSIITTQWIVTAAQCISTELLT